MINPIDHPRARLNHQRLAQRGHVPTRLRNRFDQLANQIPRIDLPLPIVMLVGIGVFIGFVFTCHLRLFPLIHRTSVPRILSCRR